MSESKPEIEEVVEVEFEEQEIEALKIATGVFVHLFAEMELDAMSVPLPDGRTFDVRITGESNE
jgi:hypothetical protein